MMAEGVWASASTRARSSNAGRFVRSVSPRMRHHWRSSRNPTSSLRDIASHDRTRGALGLRVRMAMLASRPRAAAARPSDAAADALLGAGPAGVEGVAGLVQVDDQGGVVGGDGLALAGFPVDLGPA